MVLFQMAWKSKTLHVLEMHIEVFASWNQELTKSKAQLTEILIFEFSSKPFHAVWKLNGTGGLAFWN